MLCSKCNRLIPEGADACPNCKADVATMERRCPNCWARLDIQDKQCRKCGCDIDKRIAELREEERKKHETLKDKLKKIPLWIRICVPLFIVIVIASSFAGVKIHEYNKVAEQNANAVELAENYIVSVEITTGNITKLAQAYEDMVYGQSWLDHTGSAVVVRDVYKDEIDVIKKAREPLDYAKTRVDACGNKEISEALANVHYNYNKCYGFVIGENGQYPTYMDEYNALHKEYEESIKALKEVINKYK